MKKKIAEFQGIDVYLIEEDNESAKLYCGFDDKELTLEIKKGLGEMSVIETNMNEAQIYYISDSIRELYMVLLKSRVEIA